MYRFLVAALVLRSALNESIFPTQAKLGKAVMIAPPNQGSKFAQTIYQTPGLKKILGKYAGKELATIKQMHLIGQLPPSLDVLVLAGSFGWNPFIGEKNDGKVGISETRLDSPHTHKVVFASHSLICLSKTVRKMTLDFFLKE